MYYGLHSITASLFKNKHLLITHKNISVGGGTTFPEIKTVAQTCTYSSEGLYDHPLVVVGARGCLQDVEENLLEEDLQAETTWWWGRQQAKTERKQHQMPSHKFTCVDTANRAGAGHALDTHKTIHCRRRKGKSVTQLQQGGWMCTALRVHFFSISAACFIDAAVL